MAQKVQVMLVCDLHDDETEGVETVAFGVDGASYEIDVCEEHGTAMRDAFAPYVGAARRAGRAPAPAGGGPRKRTARSTAPAGNGNGNGNGSGGGGGTSGGKERVQEIREWARANGHSVSERGRLSGAVLAAYEAAH